MPFTVSHVAIDFEGDDPRFKQYPPGTCFDCQVASVQVRYDYTSGGHIITQVLRVTGARDAEGNPLAEPGQKDAAS